MDPLTMSPFSGYSVFAVIAIICGIWLNRQIRHANERDERELAKKQDIH